MSRFKSISNFNQLNIIVLFIVSTFLLVLNSFFINDIEANIEILLLILLIIFLSIMVVSFFWLKNKLFFKSENLLNDTGKVPLWNLLLASFYFSSFLILSYIVIFNWTSILSDSFGSNIILITFGIFLTLNNVIMVLHLNDIFKPQNRPNGYIFKYLNKKIAILSNNFDTVFTLKVIIFIICIFLPLLVTYLLTNDVISAYFISSIILNSLAGSYWLGYGLYKYFAWIWGAQISTRQKSQRNLVKTNYIDFIKNLRFREGQSVFFGFLYTLFNILLLFLIVGKAINSSFTISSELLITFLVIYLFISYVIILPVTGERTPSQPWYGISFSMFSYTIPFSNVNLAAFLFSSSINLTLVFPTSTINQVKILLALVFFIAIIILFITNNKYLTAYMWKDPYESNQLLSKLKISLDKPSTIQLNLLQKLSNTLEDQDTIIKLATSYQILLDTPESKNQEDLIKSIVNFILTQISFSEEEEVLDLLFNLTHNLLDKYPKEASNFFDEYFKLLEKNNSFIKNGALNVLGQILQITENDSFIEQTYSKLESLYSSPDEKLKRLTLDAFLFFVRNNPEYLSKIKSFITQKLEYETFGIATIIFNLLSEIYLQDNDNSIYVLAKNVLTSLDSPAKLGVINFLKSNMPQEESEQKEFLELFMKNLKDIDNAIGVRTNIVYAINELVKGDKEKSYLLPELKFLISDDDPDVKSALIQSYTEQFLIQNIEFSLLRKIFELGIKEQDYIVRLIVIQSIKRIKESNNQLFTDFKPIVESALTDESQVILEEATNLLND